MKSRLLVSHFVPSRPVLPEPFTNVRKDLDQTEGALEALGKTDHAAYLARNEANRKRAQAEAQFEKLNKELRRKSRTGEDQGGLPEQVRAAEALVARYVGEMGGMTVSTKAIFTIHALPMGLELKGKFVVRNYRDRDLEILLRGLDGLSRRPVLGAHAARGCGEVSGRAEFRIGDRLDRVVTFGGYRPISSRQLSQSMASGT